MGRMELSQKLTDCQTRVVTVLERLIAMAKDNEGDAEVLADTLDEYLDSLAQDDFFGTEQQMDPRGDFRGRAYYWSMHQVEGVDA